MKEKYKDLMSKLSEEKSEQVARLKNDQYRSGKPTIPDENYDALMAAGAELYPNNAWFNQIEVEPEPELIEGKTVKLPARMLSTDKAYSHKEIEKWANDVIAVGKSLGMAESDIFFRITPKLDGFAAYDDGTKLYTRGDGRSGTDITRAFDRGLQCAGQSYGKSGKGPGEIVVNKEYFKAVLSYYYENSRNVIASIIKEGDPDEIIAETIAGDWVLFHPFSELNGWMRNKACLMCDLEQIWEDNLKSCTFDTDGLVIEAIDENIKKHMGHTNHHHKWQIAYKKNEEYHNIRVTGLVWQTSKNGRLTPVVQLEPTKVSGVTISKATGHHAGNIQSQGIGPHAVVRVCRSGLVIPYIESVVERAPVVWLPAGCPSCGAATELDGDNLLCTNTETCPAQIEGIIEFFFKTLGNCDGFGPKVISQLCSGGTTGVKKITDIYQFDIDMFQAFGFGHKTSCNLFEELNYSRSRQIEDWRFLAAFSIHNIGKGGCEKLLQHHRLSDVFSLTVADIVSIDGFADKSARSLLKSLANIKPQFDYLMKLGFNLIETPHADEQAESAISGKTVVFTGSMIHGGRADMEKQAKMLGAKVSGSVSSKTDYLVCGANVGAAKTQAAEKNGVKVLSEDEYLALLG